MDTKEILIAARERLLTKGWHKGSAAPGFNGNVFPLEDFLEDYPDVPTCAYAALFSVTRNASAADGAAYELDAFTREIWGVDVIEFNDEVAETVDDVIVVFDAAICQL
jgi:hypothetical protein